MSNREMAMEVVRRMDDEKLEEFLTVFIDENELARIETDMIAKDKNRKHFDSFSDILEEINREDV